MKNKTKVSTLAATIMMIGSLAGGANGAVLFTFEEVGDDVVASFSGSISLVGLSRTLDDFDLTGSGGAFTTTGGVSNLLGTNPSFDRYDGGSGFGSLDLTGSLGVTASSVSSFGFSDNSVFVAPSTALNGVASPTGTFTFSGASFVSLGLTSLTTMPFTVYENTNASGDEGKIQYALAVPEPSSVLLLTLSSGLLFLRRRN